jgi:predicted HTH transcriptional regulator
LYIFKTGRRFLKPLFQSTLMDLREIKKLVRNGENETTEFKKKANFPDKIVKEIVAFANTKGGHLLVGVDDDGTITGTKTPEEDLYVLEEAISKFCFPSISYTIDVIRISDKRALLHYSIFESKTKPHYVQDHQLNGKKKVYVRLNDKSIQASYELKEILKGSNRKKDMKVQFRDKERILMNYLGENPEITLNEFTKIAKIKRHVASKTLIWLVLSNILEIVPREDEDVFRQKLAVY